MTETTITKTIYIAASRETVWAYLTDKDKLGEWFHPAGDDLAVGDVGAAAFQFRDFVADEVVQSLDADPGFALVDVVVIIADVIEVVAVVKYAYLSKEVVADIFWHSMLTLFFLQIYSFNS